MQRDYNLVKGWLLLAMSLVCELAFAQSSSLEIFHIPPEIKNYTYCQGQLQAAPEVNIVGRDLDQSGDGIKISIANYIRGEDTLIYKGISKFQPAWDNTFGYLTLTGSGTDEEYTEAVHQVYYENLAQTPTLGTRSLSVTLSDADYLPYTGHFYKFIYQPGIYWTAAKAAAEALVYNGLKGYLATILSKVENDFIWTKTKGVGWIGASDAAVEGEWRWVTGPEAGQQFWQGDYRGGPVNGMYNFWNFEEPNNLNDEDYAHINNSSINPLSWNDLRDQSGAPNSAYYSQGYIVEFGSSNDALRLSASINLNIRKVAFSDKRSFEICAGETVELNSSGTTQYSYAWTPSTGLSSANDPSPDASPAVTTTYSVTGNYQGSCPASADFTVTVNPLPVSTLDSEYPLCEGGSKLLDPGQHNSYIWSDGSGTRTITVNQPGSYEVILRNEFCSLKDITTVFLSQKPQLTIDPADTLVCGQKSTQLDFTLSDGIMFLSALTAPPVITQPGTLKPSVTVPQFGSFPFKVTMTNKDGCIFDSLFSVSFRHQPTAIFNIDSTACYGYNLQVEFKGERENDAIFSWYSSDTIFSSGMNLEKDTIPLGTGGQLNRSVYMAINEQGCHDISAVIPVKVKPDMGFSIENVVGCPPLGVKFTAFDNPSVRSWNWDFGDGSSATTRETSHAYIHSFDQETSFDVKLLVRDNKGCENYEVRQDAITVYPYPDASFQAVPDVVFMTNPYIKFENKSIRADSFIWNFGDGQAPSSEVSPTHRFTGMGYFDVQLDVFNQWGCTDSTIRRVAVAFDRLFPPTAFSPNAPDEADRIFSIGSEGVSEEGYELKIYDRWGKALFVSHSPDTGWDGKMVNGNNAPPGVYTYTLQFLDFRQKSHSQQGSVTLIY